jgi:uncharacterized protein (TIGR00255 family)
LDISVKAPKIFLAYEDVLRSVVREKLTRGHADVFVSFKDKRERPATLSPDMQLAASYVAAAEQLKQAFPSLTDDLTLTAVLRYPDVLKSDENVAADEELLEALKTALNLALDNLNRMRFTEGEKLKADMLSRMVTIEGLVNDIAARAPLVSEEYKKKLETRVKEYLAGVNADEGRLLTEVALFADKSNIDEEITRLYSHIAQFRSISEEGIVGRKLDFLVQEFNREANTACSKSNDIALTKLGLALKNEIEKVREQVQNLE